MPPATLYDWIQRGWVEARQQHRLFGRWLVWADDTETARLKQLRAENLAHIGRSANVS
jgi:hypothetical protein